MFSSSAIGAQGQPRARSIVRTSALALLAAASGCGPTSNQQKDVREWFADHRVDVADSAIRCSSFRDDYACEVSIANVGIAKVLVTEHADSRTLKLDNARWGGSVEHLVTRAFARMFAGAVMEDATCPPLVISQPGSSATCTGRFEGAAVSMRFAPRFTADEAAVELEVSGLITADKLEAVARDLAVTTKAGELTFQCDRRVYRFGRQVRCAAVSSELSDGPSLAAEFMIAADGKLSSRIVTLSAGAPWTPIPTSTDSRPATAR